MTFNQVVSMVLLLSVRMVTGQSQTVDVTPQLNSNDYVAKVSTDRVILNQPWCYFANLTSMTCASETCEIWLVPALDSAIATFDADESDANILSLSPYPNAFSSNSSKQYFLTKVGLQSDFPCPNATTDGFFQVGADGSCSTTNCNGVLPVGSTTRFKYLLVDPTNKTVLAGTKWSDNITLFTPLDHSAIDDGLPGRSGAMIVITTILSVALFLLLVLLLVALIVALCCKKKAETARISIQRSFRIPRYDTHHMTDVRSPYVNKAYEEDNKRYTITDTLPRGVYGGAIN